MKESIFNYHSVINDKNYLFNTNNGGLLELTKSDFNNEEKDYLARQGFYVDENIDEIQKLEEEVNESIWSGSESLELTIALTNQCNFKCAYCYQDKNQKVMSMQVADDILQKIESILSKGNYKEIYIHYFGGEPLLNIPILKYLDNNICKSAQDNHVKYVSFITTNGEMLDDSVLQSVKLDHIQLTFDGREETHNKLRISETFHFKDEIALLKKILDTTNARITLRMNACVENKEEIREFYQSILKQFGYERIDINLNRMIKFHEKDNFEMLDQKEYAQLFFDIKKLYEEITGKFQLPIPRKTNCKFICGMAYSISPDGYCNFCSGSVENGTILFKDIDITKRNEIKFRKECKSCTFLPLCLVGCIVQHNIGAGCCTYEKFCMEDILKYYIEKTEAL